MQQPQIAQAWDNGGDIYKQSNLSHFRDNWYPIISLYYFNPWCFNISGWVFLGHRDALRIMELDKNRQWKFDFTFALKKTAQPWGKKITPNWIYSEKKCCFLGETWNSNTGHGAHPCGNNIRHPSIVCSWKTSWPDRTDTLILGVPAESPLQNKEETLWYCLNSLQCWPTPSWNGKLQHWARAQSPSTNKNWETQMGEWKKKPLRPILIKAWL